MPTKISFTAYGETFTWETVEEDCTISQVIAGFYNVLRGATFSGSTIKAGMQEFLNNYDG